ncbi:MAG: hypothetical protein ABSH32_18265 [Bryobacteraceae bacterium]
MGESRWRAPRAALAWSGIRQADKFGPICMQCRRGLGPITRPLAFTQLEGSRTSIPKGWRSHSQDTRAYDPGAGL